MNFQLQFFNPKVQANIEAWPSGINASFVRIAEQMVVSGPNLGMPYTRPFSDGLFEIRAKGAEGIGRAFFAASLAVALLSCMGSSKRPKQHLQKNWQLLVNVLRKLNMTDANKFSPVAFDPKGYAAKRRKADPKFSLAYDALEDEFSTLAALLKARASAGLTQAEVATRMGVSQPVVARIEASLGKKVHSPSLNTLRRYADACGMKLVIHMVAQ